MSSDAWIDAVSADPAEMSRTVLRILDDEGWVVPAASGADAAGAVPVMPGADGRFYNDLLL